MKNKIGKLIATGALITSMAVSLIPTEALANVKPEDILGDIQYYEMYGETRDAIKQSDAEILKYYFRGHDDYGCETVTTDEIAKAKEMSDFLSTYNDPTFEYTNCTPGEICGLNINSLYNDYLNCVNNGNPYDFMSRNLYLKPAIDAYLNFAGLAVSNRMKENLANMVYNYVASEGRNITRYPSIEIRNGQIYAVLAVDGALQVINITGEVAYNAVYICSNLDYRTNMILSNISGQTDAYPQSFAYNGVSAVTFESAYLSMPDSEYKNYLMESANYGEKLRDYSYLELYLDDPANAYGLNANEVELLYSLGYSSEAINAAVLRYASIYPAQTYTK